MRSLEEWFKYVESFDHTDDAPAADHHDDPAPAQHASSARAAVAEPPRAPAARPAGSISRDDYPAPERPQRTFRAAPAPPPRAEPTPTPVAARPQAQPYSTGRTAPVPKPRPVAPPPSAPLPKESREQLLSRLLDPVLTLEEAAQVLNVCPTTVRRYTNRNLLQHYRTSGNQRRFRLSHVLKFLDEMGGAIDSGTLSDSSESGGLGRATKTRVRSAR